MSSWNPVRDSWFDWSNDPSNSGSTRNQEAIAAAVNWRNTHGIDPNTGDLTGTPGLVPGEFGLEFQFLHEQGRDRARQARMRSASNYARGALGLLQSFRPGGGATLEAGQYNALAQIEQNRAQMLQPLDLLGDYRRHETALANQRSNRARETSTIVQLAAIAVSAAAGGVGGAVAGGLLGGMGSLLGGFGGGGGDNASLSQGPYGPQRQGGTVNLGNLTPSAGMPQSGEQQQLQQEDQPSTMQSQLAPGQQQGSPQQKKMAQGQPGQQQQMGAHGQPGQAQGGAQGQGFGQPGGGMGAPMVGADGNFQPVAYASAAAASMIDPMQGVVMSLSLANRIEEDPAWAQISFAVDQRLRIRLQGAAA